MNHHNHTYLKRRSGIYYYTRRIPCELQQRYNRDRLYVSLRTRSRRKAMAASERLSNELETIWSQIRAEGIVSKVSSEVRLLTQTSLQSRSALLDNDEVLALPYISVALETYLDLKGRDRSPNFESSVRRSVSYLIEELGDKRIDKYARREALAFRDALLQRQLSISSVKRNFTNINAVLGLVCKELGHPDPATFRGLFFKATSECAKRLAVPPKQLQQLQIQCMTTDDELRWLLAMISDTGVRLSEAIGLSTSDIKLHGTVPHLVLQPHPWRRLKTTGSRRKVPLVGSALWAAHRIIANHRSSFAFPRFCNDKSLKSNSVSANLNKWLKLKIGDEYVIHSLRHSFRDRLRAVDCPTEVADALGGWSVKTVGQSYGAGYNLETLFRWMKQIEVVS